MEEHGGPASKCLQRKRGGRQADGREPSALLRSGKLSLSERDRVARFSGMAHLLAASPAQSWLAMDDWTALAAAFRVALR